MNNVPPQQAYNQPVYQQPLYQSPALEGFMSTKDWLVTILLTMIPTVGLVFLFIWAFSENTKVEKKNFARAELITMAIVVGVVILAYIAIFCFAFALASNG